MDRHELAAFLSGTVLAFAATVALVLCFDERGERVRREAVKAGVARYVADEDGRPVFEWIAPAAKEGR